MIAHKNDRNYILNFQLLFPVLLKSLVFFSFTWMLISLASITFSIILFLPRNIEKQPNFKSVSVSLWIKTFLSSVRTVRTRVQIRSVLSK